jgi:hypothetical protein
MNIYKPVDLPYSYSAWWNSYHQDKYGYGIMRIKLVISFAITKLLLFTF